MNIFVSYSRADGGEFAEKVYDYLRANSQEVFTDVNNIKVGDPRSMTIEERHDKLLTSLRTAYAEELNLKKEQTSYSDLLDARASIERYDVE